MECAASYFDATPGRAPEEARKDKFSVPSFARATRKTTEANDDSSAGTLAAPEISEAAVTVFDVWTTDPVASFFHTITGAARADPSREDSIKEATFIVRLSHRRTMVSSLQQTKKLQSIQIYVVVDEDCIKYFAGFATKV